MTAAMQRLVIGKTRLPDFGGEWTTRRLGDLADIDPENLPANTDPDHEFNYISLEQVEAGRLRGYTVEIFRTSPSRARRRLRRDDILMSTVRPNLMGHLFFDFDNEQFANTVCSTGFAVLRCKRNLCVPGFLFAHLFGPVVNKQIERTLAGSNYPAISSRDVTLIEIPCPSIREQTAIAAVLSDMDRLLESLEAVIAKKRAIKRAAMQQLLTGRIRLPGFSGKWKTKRLGRLGSFLKGRGVNREDTSSTGFSCVRYGELYTRYENYILNAVTRIPSSIAKLALPIKTGDLLFAGSGETSEEIGRCAAYLGEEPAYAGGDILVLTPLEQNSLYLGYLMNQPTVARHKARMGQGDAVVHVNARNLAQIEINLPPVEEQTAIAAVLYDMDTEIAALERRRDKTATLKQGMMQQLLTGQIRLAKSVQTTTRQASTTSTGKGHNWQINEAVVISVLAGRFGNEEYPLGRMRYTKLSYLLHRYVEGRAEGYLKKAAGPYNPRTRYGGPEKIALGKGYVRKCMSGKYQGFIAGDNAEESERYFDRWYGREALQWLEQFRYKKNNDLELLTTVDLAIEELRAEGEAVSIESVREVIHRDPEWTKKLARSTFSSANLERAIVDCEQLFGR